jgi:cardiolipin synthase
LPLVKWLKIGGLSLLGVVLVIFALIGYLNSTRETPTEVVTPYDDASALPGIGDPAFLHSVELLTRTDLHPGHTIEPLFDGDGTFPRIWQDIRAARESVIVQLYYCKPGVVADSLKRVLMESARRGVRTYVLFDAFGALELSDQYLDSLRAAGVRVAEFRPVKWYTLHKAQNRSHVRAVIVDGAVAYTGGFGIDDVWLGNGHRRDQWRETNVRFTGPAVVQLQAAFATAWAEATGELWTGWQQRAVPAAGDTSGAIAGLLHAEPVLGSTAAERFLALTISGARQTLYISNAYFVPDDDLRRMLRAAARRGVDVRVLTAGRETDVKLVRIAGRAGWEELLRAGVRIYEYRPTMLHAKTIVADDFWVTIGTMNFDNRSIAFNEESNLIVQDSAVAALMRGKFEDDLRFSKEIVLREFVRRSAFAKALERMAGMMANLL